MNEMTVLEHLQRVCLAVLAVDDGEEEGGPTLGVTKGLGDEIDLFVMALDSSDIESQFLILDIVTGRALEPISKEDLELLGETRATSLSDIPDQEVDLDKALEVRRIRQVGKERGQRESV